ncbi:uncharacterized protein (TIGR02594 family) [Rhizobium petrolearium]|uniref:NlpC/P60 family protein n=1 Tax=Neorhizobium petrolearium TaxID=515361 RepID=UPI001AE30522|nr:TIGR02594 family protein [Neorhizobium petrolearium]MBP1844779.1 uncharacterized protein (TIGR02594 family) [Neorhizobium petrolearium]
MTFEEWLISRLRAWGCYAGTMDGVHGRAVIEALRLFQASEKLPVSGVADEATVAALRRDPGVRPGALAIYEKQVPIPAEPVWMREACRFMGLREIVGPKSNSTIMSWAKKLGGWIASFYADDDIPWCGLFIGNIIATTLPRELLPKNPLGALEWGKFGKRLDAPVRGAIMTFVRPGGGHVGLYVGEDRTHYHILGGNQSNSVSITRIEKNRMAAVRWPKTGEPPKGGKIQLTAAGVPTSKNEV